MQWIYPFSAFWAVTIFLLSFVHICAIFVDRRLHNSLLFSRKTHNVSRHRLIFIQFFSFLSIFVVSQFWLRHVTNALSKINESMRKSLASDEPEMPKSYFDFVAALLFVTCFVNWRSAGDGSVLSAREGDIDNWIYNRMYTIA